MGAGRWKIEVRRQKVEYDDGLDESEMIDKTKNIYYCN
jgi:hypothetical protein